MKVPDLLSASSICQAKQKIWIEANQWCDLKLKKVYFFVIFC